VQRFGREGYRAIAEARREAGHSVVSANIRSYPSENLGTNILDNSSESQALQHEGSPMPSAQDNLRWVLILSRSQQILPQEFLEPRNHLLNHSIGYTSVSLNS
jgi:hypothetical protein